jgi:hypothetical protein
VQSGLPQKMFQFNNSRAFRPQNRKSVSRIKSKDMPQHAQPRASMRFSLISSARSSERQIR